MQDFYKFLRDDNALLRASRARWMLVPAASIANTPSGDPRELEVAAMGNGKTQETFTPDGVKIARPMGSIDLEEEECVIGSDSDCQCRVECTTVSLSGCYQQSQAAACLHCPFFCLSTLSFCPPSFHNADLVVACWQTGCAFCMRWCTPLGKKHKPSTASCP